MPVEKAPPNGSSFQRKPTKNSRKTAMITGGIPISSTNGSAMALSQPGERGQAAAAPSRLPNTNARNVVTSRRPIVQGSDSPISWVTVFGYWLKDTPRSRRAILAT